MVLACESIFSRTSLDGRPQNLLQTFSKVNLKYTKRTFPVGQARCSYHLPHSYNLQILLARGNGASTNVEPCLQKKILKKILKKNMDKTTTNQGHSGTKQELIQAMWRTSSFQAEKHPSWQG